MSDPNFVDMVSGATAVIGVSNEVVWPHLLDQAAWMTEFAIETVDGEHNQVGEVKKVMHREPGSEDFFFKTLLLVPFRKFVYKAYTESRSGQYGFTGIEVLSLGALGGESTVTFEAYLEVQSLTMTREELTKFVNSAKEEGTAMWQRNFKRLASQIAANEGK